MFDLIGFSNDIIKFFKLIFMIIYFQLEVLIKNHLIPKKLVFKNISGKTVLITGAAGGIGKCLVNDFIKMNCTVICVDVNKLLLKNLEEDLNVKYKEKKYRMYFYQIDISNIEQIKEMGQNIREKFGKIDILINSAGIMNKAKVFLDLTEKEILNIFNVNILSIFWLCKEFLPDMLANNEGHIINISSSLGVYGGYRLTDYSSTKFALNGFTESLRHELKTINKLNNVKVSLVCPFHVKTNLFNGVEIPSMKWASTSLEPETVSKDVLEGVLLGKELIGCPKMFFWIFYLIKK